MSETKELIKAIQELTTEIVALQDLLTKQRETKVTAASSLPTRTISAFKCPLCEKQMVKRTRRSDRAAFYGCSDYPDCTGSRDIDGKNTSRGTPRVKSLVASDLDDDMDQDVPF